MVFRQASRVLLVLTLCLAVGGHWLALQSVAWATMLIENSSREPFAVALAQTFDGQHPCALCKGVNAAQQSQKKNSAQSVSTKLDLVQSEQVVSIKPDCTDFFFNFLSVAALPRVASPPVPPPRSELV